MKPKKYKPKRLIKIRSKGSWVMLGEETWDFYRGVREQDGWETLRFTVEGNHIPVEAEIILNALKEDQIKEKDQGPTYTGMTTKKFQGATKPLKPAVAELLANYPLLKKVVEREPSYSYQSLKSLNSARDPYLHAEKIALYNTLSSLGPDVSFEQLGKLVTKARRALANVLEAWEDGRLESWLEEVGMFGPKSDVLRSPADRYFGAATRRRRRLALRRPNTLEEAQNAYGKAETAFTAHIQRILARVRNLSRTFGDDEEIDRALAAPSGVDFLNEYDPFWLDFTELERKAEDLLSLFAAARKLRKEYDQASDDLEDFDRLTRGAR